MTGTCPSCGGRSATDDYCDQCGAPMVATAVVPAARPEHGPAAAPVPVTGECPSCGADRTADDVFCEVCGLDFATGKLPATPARPKPAAPVPAVATGWVAVIEADRAFFLSNQADSATPLVFPESVPPREIELTGAEVGIGRRSDERGHFPAIDLGGAVEDPAVSHRHAVLRRTPDGSWAIVDEGSTNGTWLNDDPDPVKPGVPVPLRDGDRIHLGAFTRVTIKRRSGT